MNGMIAAAAASLTLLGSLAPAFADDAVIPCPGDGESVLSIDGNDGVAEQVWALASGTWTMSLAVSGPGNATLAMAGKYDANDAWAQIGVTEPLLTWRSNPMALPDAVTYVQLTVTCPAQAQCGEATFQVSCSGA